MLLSLKWIKFGNKDSRYIGDMESITPSYTVDVRIKILNFFFLLNLFLVKKNINFLIFRNQAINKIELEIKLSGYFKLIKFVFYNYYYQNPNKHLNYFLIKELKIYWCKLKLLNINLH